MKRIASMICLFLLTLSIAGCQKTPESQIVIGKGDAALERALDQGSNTNSAKYEAPEHWTDSVERNNLFITVDANVSIPNVDQFPSAVITTDEISQQTADNIIAVLLSGAALYESRPNYPYTKEEIDKEISSIKESIADPNSDFNQMLTEGTAEYDELLAEKQKKITDLEKAYSSAPDTIDTKPAETTFHQAENPDASRIIFIGNDIPEADRKQMEAAQEAAEQTPYYKISGETVLNSGEKANLLITKSSARFSLETSGNIENAEEQKRYNIPVTEGGITEAQAREKAVQTIKDIGINYLDITDFEESYFIERDTDGMPVSKRPCYTFYFMRSINGVTENYALAKDVPLMEGQYRQTVIHESVKMTIGKEGIIIFEWWTPTRITEMKSQNVNILSFEDIQDIFRKQVILDNIYTPVSVIASAYNLSVLEKHIVIENAKLGMMRVLRQGHEGEYLMIPVWDFYGYEKLVFDDPKAAREMQFGVNESGEYIEKNMYQSFLTINAIDGSIINRQQGY